MLRRPHRLLAGLLAALMAAPAVAVGTAGVAQADAVRAQELWVLNAIDAPTAWQTTMGRGVTVAVIDSGVNGSVSALAGPGSKGRDFTGVNTPPAKPAWGGAGDRDASAQRGARHPGGPPERHRRRGAAGPHPVDPRGHRPEGPGRPPVRARIRGARPERTGQRHRLRGENPRP